MKRLLLHVPNPEERDTLLAENPLDPLANDQTLLDEDEVNDAQVQYEDIVKEETKKKLVPKGTSSYQAAWIVEDEDGEDNGDDDEDGSMVTRPSLCLSGFCLFFHPFFFFLLLIRMREMTNRAGLTKTKSQKSSRRSAPTTGVWRRMRILTKTRTKRSTRNTSRRRVFFSSFF